MSETVVSKRVFEALLKHLVDIEERRDQLLDRYYPVLTKERENFRVLLDEYIKKVEERISSSKVVDNDEIACPFIFIGSVVELESLDGTGIEKYHIVSPYESQSDSSIDFVSCLSPMGKALLLREVNDKVTIENPSGEFSYTVKSISAPEVLFSTVCKDG